MQNQYWLVPTELLDKIQTRGVTDSDQPHENVHWRVSLDGSMAIVQGNFDDSVVSWLAQQKNVTKLGNYHKGSSEKAVRDFVKNNKAEWETEDV